MTDTVRLFVALPVPRDFIGLYQTLPRKGLDARWTHPDDLHITLRFLGDVDPARIEAVTEALGRVRRAPFHLDIKGLGVFENKQAVLYARIESVRKITTLCADITDVLAKQGFDFGPRPFVPHITLAHVHGAQAVPSYIARHARAVSAHGKVDGFCLMRSAAPDEKGRHYSILSHFPLTG